MFFGFYMFSDSLLNRISIHVVYISIHVYTHKDLHSCILSISLREIGNCSLLHLKDFPLKFLARDHLLIRAGLFTPDCVVAKS